MSPDGETDARLLAYIERSKFLDPNLWDERGLNPSPIETVQRMEALVNGVAGAALSSRSAGQKAALTRKAMLGALRCKRASEFDTEEREIICEEVESIATLVGVSMSGDLNAWMYGRKLGFLLKAIQALKPKKKVLVSYESCCSSCQSTIAVDVMEASPKVPDTGWVIVSCESCGEPGLIRLGPHALQIDLRNCKWMEPLPLKTHTPETAEARLRDVRVKRSQ